MQNVFAKAKISLYKNSKDNKGYAGSYAVLKIIEAIKSDKGKSSTLEYQRLLRETPGAPAATTPATKEYKKVIRDFKEFNFKGVTWSGTFSHRKTDGLTKHTGLICMDFDHLKGEALNNLRFKLINDPFTFILFTSPSGAGLKVVVKTECTTGPDHKEKFFPLLKQYYIDTYEITADASGCNVDRLCFLPWDPNIYSHDDALIFGQAKGGGIIATSSGYADTEDQIEQCIQALKAQNIDLTSNYDTWRNIGFALATLGEDGRKHFHAVSALYSAYDQEETDYKFSNFLQTRSGAIGISTFFFHCKEAGVQLSKTAPVTPESLKRRADFKEIYKYIHDVNRGGRPWQESDLKFLTERYNITREKAEEIFKKIYEDNKDQYDIDNKPDIFRVELFLNEYYKFRRNEITGAEECRLLEDGEDFTPINEDSIFRHLQKSSFKYAMDKLKSLLKSDFVPTINPFHEYFYNLPSWDPATGPDYIDTLADFVSCEDQNFWKVMFKKALVRSIACSIGGRENRIVMVLVEENQNTGKTSFIRFLNPFGDLYYTESPLRDNKDSEFAFAENFIYNLEELSSLGALDINKLKAIISKAWIKERPAYGRRVETKRRRCNFWGSTNKPEFLTDTQNTRWLCFKVKNINHDYRNTDTGIQNVNINNVWSQAYALYKSGFSYQLTPEESTQRDTDNKGHEQTSNERDLVIKFLKPGTEFIFLADIELMLLEKSDNKLKLNRMALGRALVQLGFKVGRAQINGHRAQGYHVERVITQIMGANDVIQFQTPEDDDQPF